MDKNLNWAAMVHSDENPLGAGAEWRQVQHVFADQLFTGDGDEVRASQLISIDNGRVASVDPAEASAIPYGTIRTPIAAPGFIDLQINGAADIQFNDDPTVEAIKQIAWGARQGGTAHILPTFITDGGDRYRLAIKAAERAIETGVSSVLGVHLEGPFLSPERPGIHPARFIRPVELADIEHLTAARCCILMTLAPEVQDRALMRRLAEAGVQLFAGHTNATHNDLLAAIETGLSGVTHLFNAQSQIAGREPGTVGTALMHPKLSAGIIADGHHVHPQNLAMAARLMADRLFLVTDAMQTLAGKQTSFNLMGTPVTLKDGRLTGLDGTLAGAQLAMDEAVRNAVSMMGVSPAQALRMASGNAARALGLGGELGRLVPGYRASLTCLSASLHAEQVIVDGHLPHTEG